MKIISKGETKSDLHTVQRESAYSTQDPHRERASNIRLRAVTKIIIKKIQPEQSLADFFLSFLYEYGAPLCRPFGPPELRYNLTFLAFSFRPQSSVNLKCHEPLTKATEITFKSHLCLQLQP